MPLVTVWPTPKRVANGQHGVAHLQVARIAQGNGWRRADVDFEHGQIGVGVCADDGGRHAPTVCQLNLDIAGGFQHVVVGQDVAFRTDDDAASHA